MWYYFLTSTLLAIWQMIKEVKESQAKDEEPDIALLIFVFLFILFLAPIATIVEIVRLATGYEDGKETKEEN
jgi:hypothetical protein